MKVEQRVEILTPNHKSVVFDNAESAQKSDMKKVIGRFEPVRRSILFIDDNDIGRKYKALFDAGFGLDVNQTPQGSYYVTGVSDSSMNESMQVKGKVKNQENDIELENEVDEQGELSRVDENEFLEQYIDSAIDINFSTPKMKHEHRIGLLNMENNKYAIRPDLVDLLDESGDFEVEIDDDGEDDTPFAQLDASTLKVTVLKKLINKLTEEDTEEPEKEVKEPVIKEAEIGRDNVYFPALKMIKTLKNMIRLSQRHGDSEGAQASIDELQTEIDTYADAHPPAEGVDEVQAELDELKQNQPKQGVSIEECFIENGLDFKRTRMVTTDDLIQGALR